MTDPVAHVAVVLAVLLISGKLAGELAIRVRQPAVLGELVAGIVLGNVGLAWFDAIKVDPMIDILAGLGVLFLLFQVGVESTVAQMMQVGLSSLIVATLGVVAPFGLGWLVAAWLLPQAGPYEHAFIAATLCATSVGITARVLQDLGVNKSLEARVILGAAVIDDVFGLVILGVVSGAIASIAKGQTYSVAAIGGTAALALAFLAGAMAIGRTAVPRLFAAGALLRGRGVLVTLGMSLCFAMSWLATEFGLAPIIGAFAAGLILDEVHFRDYANRGERGLEELLQPISDLLVPIFFVLVGLRTDLAAFGEPGVVGLAAGLTAAAIAGKQLCSLGVVTRGVNRLAVGVGMIPRGEVGLIFANIGLGLTMGGQPVVSRPTFSALVAMVVITTVVTPPALAWCFRHRTNVSGARVNR